jgi:hypothetical protein
MKRLALVLSVILGSGLAAGQVFAFGDNCKDVKLTVVNHVKWDGKPVEIKVVKAHYYDYDAKKWRTEGLRNWVLLPNDRVTWTENFEHVKNDQTRIRVEYWVYDPAASSSGLGGVVGSTWYRVFFSHATDKFKCNRGDHKTMTIKNDVVRDPDTTR